MSISDFVYDDIARLVFFELHIPPLITIAPQDASLHNLMKAKSNESIEVLSTSKMESIGTKQFFPHFEKPENYSLIHGGDSRPEPSYRWVKRLRHSPLDSLTLATKRSKTMDVPYRGQAQNLLIRILNYDDCSSYLSKCREEHQEYDNIPLLRRNGERSSGDRNSETVNCWIRRWCRRSQQADLPKLVTQALCKTPERLNAIHENFEVKQFPSIAAMALMGSAAKNSRPCHFQKKGSLVVWNTE